MKEINLMPETPDLQWVALTALSELLREQHVTLARVSYRSAKFLPPELEKRLHSLTATLLIASFEAEEAVTLPEPTPLPNKAPRRQPAFEDGQHYYGGQGTAVNVAGWMVYPECTCSKCRSARQLVLDTIGKGNTKGDTNATSEQPASLPPA